MRIASIDLGSNSFLLLIAKFDSFKKLSVEKESIEVVRLGEGLGTSGKFSPQALERAKNCLKHFKQTINEYNVNWTEAVTTSAARRASNFADLKRITDQLQIPLKVIAGEEEARLTYIGATEGAGNVVIDVGGGSTELVTEEAGEFSCNSFEFGSVRLLEKYITKQPIQDCELQNIKKEIDHQLNSKKDFLTSLKNKNVYAVAGTPTTLAALIKDVEHDPEVIEGLKVSLMELNQWIATLADLSVDQRMMYRALKNAPGRADVIVVGLVCLSEALKAIGAKEFIVSTKGVRYGLAQDIFNKHSYLLAGR